MHYALVPVGIAGILVSLVHGYLGQTHLIARAEFPGRTARGFVSLIWQYSTVTWVACCGLIAASPWLFDERTRPLGVGLACLPLLYGTLGNAWVSRGRHFGWKALAAVIAAAIALSFA